MWCRDCGHLVLPLRSPGTATAVMVPRLRSPGSATAATWYRAATAVTTSAPHSNRQHCQYRANHSHRDSMNSPPTIVVVKHKPLGRFD